MIVHNSHVKRILALTAEANPPLVVHADAVLAFAVVLFPTPPKKKFTGGGNFSFFKSPKCSAFHVQYLVLGIDRSGSDKAFHLA